MKLFRGHMDFGWNGISGIISDDHICSSEFFGGLEPSNPSSER